MPTPETRSYIVSLALKLQGTPYIWGGTSPRTGLDCSGFIIWILQVFGLLPAGDWRAADLADCFTKTDTPQPGDLVFYGGIVVSHVMMYIGSDMVVGASGGGMSTVTVEEAARRGACVKIKPMYYRSDFLFCCDIGVTKPHA